MKNKYFGYEYYFFDFFGTLMFRKCSNSDIKKIWSNKLSKYLFSVISSQDLYSIRRSAELGLAGKNNCEFTYKELISNVYDRIVCLVEDFEYNYKSFFNICYNIELQTEIENQKLNLKIFDFAKKLKQQGKKIYVLSDFYLDVNALNCFLENKLVKDLFDGIFVSCEIGANKLNGDIYKVILNRLGANPKSCLMIGDNYKSDIVNARKININTLQVNTRKISGKAIKSNKILFGLQTKQKCDGISYSNYAFALFRFISKLYDELNKIKFNKVYFFSREGEFLKILFDLYCQIVNDKFGLPIIESRYLYVSRQSTYLAGLKQIEDEDFSSMFKEYRDISVHAFLSNLTFSENEINTLKENCDFDFDKTIYNFQISEQFKMLKNLDLFCKYYDNNLREKKFGLLTYLDSNGFYSDDKVAVVDIGWKGSIQDNIFKAKDSVTIYGYYYGLNNNAKTTTKNKKFGLNFYEYPFKSKGYLVWSFDCNFLERLCTSSHASTKSYCIENNNVAPIFNTFKREENNYNLIKPIQVQLVKTFENIVKTVYGLPILTNELEHILSIIHVRTCCKVNKSNIILQQKLLMGQDENFGYQNHAGDRINSLYRISNLKKYYRSLKDPIKVSRLLASKKLYATSSLIYRLQFKKIIKRINLEK